GGPAAAPGFPRLERTLERVERAAVQRLELEEELPVLDRLGVLDADLSPHRPDLRLDLVHELHRLEDAKRLARRHRIALHDERLGTWLRRAGESPDHRRLDPDRPVRGRAHWGLGLSRRHRRGRAQRGHHGRLVAPPHGHARLALLDRDLPDPRLLHDADELADPLCLALFEPGARQALGVSAAASDRAEEEILVAGCEPLGYIADVVELDRLLLAVRTLADQLNSPADARVDLGRRRA